MYCIFAQLTNSNFLGKLPIHDTNNGEIRGIDNLSYRLFFYLDKKDEIYHYCSKEHPKIAVKLQSLVARWCKIRNIAIAL